MRKNALDYLLGKISILLRESRQLGKEKIYDHLVEFEILLLIEVPKEPRGI